MFEDLIVNMLVDGFVIGIGVVNGMDFGGVVCIVVMVYDVIVLVGI